LLPDVSPCPQVVHLFLLPLSTIDPFADARNGDDLLSAGTKDSSHIRIQQRNRQEDPEDHNDNDRKKVMKTFNKFACNGTVIEHPEYGELIQLQGDQQERLCKFQVERGLAKDDQLKVHGF
jgi:translation initiation factor 1